VAKLVGADSAEGEEEIVVTAGATAGLNLLATAFGNASLGRGGEAAKRFALKPGDEIVVTKAEHHSVLLPFQELALRTGATLKWFDLDEEGRVRSDTADEVITDRTKIVAVTHVGNTTGAITDIAPIIRRAHEVGAVFVLDACQSVPHLKVDFHALDVDFAAWSAHKMYGPTGVGFLYGKREMLEALPPANFGGSMVELAWMDQKIIFDKTPFKAALHILKKRYNVDFIVNTSKFDKYTFTGAFTEQYIEEILENFKISSHIRWRNVKLTNNQSEERRQIEIY
jgi:cysteine desulfurase/selenocysteine lyase